VIKGVLIMVMISLTNGIADNGLIEDTNGVLLALYELFIVVPFTVSENINDADALEVKDVKLGIIHCMKL